MADAEINYQDSRIWKYAVAHANKKERTLNTMDQFKENTLKGHVEKCQLRYEYLEQKLEALDGRITKVEDKISALKGEMHSGFAEIKLLIERQNNARTIQLIATVGTIVAALIGLLAYAFK